MRTARKVILSMYDHVQTRMTVDGLSTFTFVAYDTGWPEDKHIILPKEQSDKSAAVLARCVVIPAIALKVQEMGELSGFQLGAGVEDSMPLLLEWYVLSPGQQIDFGDWLLSLLEDTVLYVKDWTQYPQTPAPNNLYEVEIVGQRVILLEDAENANKALRWGGYGSFAINYQRSQGIVTNA